MGEPSQDHGDDAEDQAGDGELQPHAVGREHPRGHVQELRHEPGVGGGILAIAPGKAAIAVWSPGLNANGNSLLGTLALERLTEATGWSVFAR